MKLTYRRRVFFLATLIVGLALVSCDKPSGNGEAPVSPSGVSKDYLGLTLSATDNPSSAHLAEGGEAGFFLIKPGTLLGSSTTVGSVQNARYGLSGSSFLPKETSKAFPKEPTDFGYSLVGYAPYRSGLTGFSFPLNISDQSDTTRINVLRFTSIDPAGNPVRLRTERILPRLLLYIKAGDERAKALFATSAPRAEVSGALLSGIYDIATGTFEYDGLRGRTVAQTAEAFPGLPASGDAALLKAYFLPGETLSSLSVTVTIGTEKLTFRPSVQTMAKGGLYLIRLTVKGDAESGRPTLTDLSQQEWSLSGRGIGSVLPIAYTGAGSSSGETPESGRTSYMERPFSGTGHPDAVELDHFAPGSYFSDGGSAVAERRNYSIYFSRDNRLPLWVAYPLYPGCLGSQSRDELWQYDPKLDEASQPNLTKSYAEYGMTRGHMCPSGSRNASKSLMHTTYYFTNMIPQDYDFNGGTWLDLENKERVWAKDAARYDTLYIVCGPILYKDLRKTADKFGHDVAKPEYAYKAILAKDKRDGSWYSMAVRMSNSVPPSSAVWSDYMVTVDALEKELGFTLFPNLPDNVAASVKQQLDKTRWR